MNTVFAIANSILVILFAYFDIMESKENRHLRELYDGLNKAIALLFEQNRELWKLSKVAQSGRDDSHV